MAMSDSRPPSIRYVPSSAAHTGGIGRWLRIVLGMGLALAGVVLFGEYLDRTMPQTPLPVLGQAASALVVTERGGHSVDLASLRGKVTVMACLYTVCPHGCAAVMQQMQSLNAAHRLRKDFHQVSLAVAPERDTPAFLKTYAEGAGVQPADPWWFVTGDQPRIWDFMSHELRLEAPRPVPPEKRLNPLDLYEHDLRIVLLDRRGAVRGYYSVFHPQPEIAALMCGRLSDDVQRLLEDPSL